jgi:hypothetical protein
MGGEASWIEFDLVRLLLQPNMRVFLSPCVFLACPTLFLFFQVADVVRINFF